MAWMPVWRSKRSIAPRATPWLTCDAMSDPAALFAAIEEHDLDRLVRLLAGGTDPNAKKPAPPGWLPLHEAIEQIEDGGSIEALVLLLRSGARVEGDGGDTPLLMALYREQAE